MTTQELIDFYKSLLAYDLDSQHGASPSDANVVADLNRALRWISNKIGIYKPSLTLSLATDTGDDYPLFDLTNGTCVSSVVVELFNVTIDGIPLAAPLATAGFRQGLWTLGELNDYYPYWRTSGEGVPVRAVWLNARHLMLWPKPTAAIKASTNHQVGARVLAADLSASALSGVPEIPNNCHEAIAYFAAANTGLATASEPEQINRLNSYKAQAEQVILDTARESNGSFSNQTINRNINNIIF